MNELNKLREQIDKIDSQIVKLLCERFDTVKKVAEYKKAHTIEILQKSRETEILNKITENIDSQEYLEYMLEIYKKVLETSKSLQGGINADK